MKDHLGEQPSSRDKVGAEGALRGCRLNRIFTDSSLLFQKRNSWKLVPSSETMRFLVKLKINGSHSTDSSTGEQTKAAPSFSLHTGVQTDPGVQGQH